MDPWYISLNMSGHNIESRDNGITGSDPRPLQHPYMRAVNEIPALKRYWTRMEELRLENPDREIPQELETGMLFLATFIHNPKNLGRIADAYDMEHETARDIVDKMYDPKYEPFINDFYRPFAAKKETDDVVVDERIIFENDQERINRIFRESLTKVGEVLTPFERQIYESAEKGMSYQTIADTYNISPVSLVAKIYSRALGKIEQKSLAAAGLKPASEFVYKYKDKEIGIGNRVVAAATRGAVAAVKFGSRWFTMDDIAERYAKEHIRIVDEELLAQDYILMEAVRRLFPREHQKLSYCYYHRGEKELVREEQNVLYVSHDTLERVRNEQLPRRWNPLTFKSPEPELQWLPTITDYEHERERLRHAFKTNKLRGVKSEKGWLFVDPTQAKNYLKETKPRS